MNVDNENECIDIICHRLSFHRLSCVAEDGSTFVCHSQFCQMNDDIQSHRGRFVGGGEDGGEGVRRKYADEQGEDGGDDDGVVHDLCAWSDDDDDDDGDGIVHGMMTMTMEMAVVGKVEVEVKMVAQV